jgi:RNA recognition motif-containing protein
MQPYFPAQMMNPALMSEKDNEFSKGIYVSGFERSLTSEMLEKHFKIKPITGMKLPLTKYQENKGFAFIYYNSKDDAAYVKETLDHTVILINKIRVTKTVNAEHLSKMMFKLKTTGKSEA